MPRYTVEIDSNGTFWYKEGTNILHREDGPAVEHAEGTKEWWVNGKWHREDGPAVEHAEGTKEWWVDGKVHRLDGPAIEYANGYKCWYLNGKPHREDGPAVEHAEGTKEWWVDGERMTETEFLKRTQKTCQGKIVEIDGIKYRLTAVE